MKHCNRFTFSLFLIVVLALNYNASAQILLKKVSLKTQIDNSDLVIEGKVINKKSTWDANHKMIYTINTIEVFKIFKGASVSYVDVVTVGGTVGLDALVVYPTLDLYKDDIGVFALNEDSTPFSKKSTGVNKKFTAFGVSQGFFKYNLVDNLAATPFVIKHNITTDFYGEIKKYSKSDILEVKHFKANVKPIDSSAKLLNVPSAITLNRTEVTAGTADVLTITGSNFGTNQGKVKFRDANNGGASFTDALDSQVRVWNDNEIVVEVPSRAGTGTIRVENSSGELSPASSVLTILYSESNVESDPDDRSGFGGLNGPQPRTAYQVQHINQNNSGGMTWEMQTDFFNDTEFPGAKGAVMRALDTWVCETGINWSIAPSATSVDTAGNGTDGVNVIRFDNGNELNTNTLGICFSWFSGCFSGGDLQWFVSELDLVFNDNVNWHTGTGTPPFTAFDFESVALHELGHGHQLGHVVDANNNSVGNNGEDVMHFAFTNGEKQSVLTINNQNAANGIQNRSTSASVCGEPIMASTSCTLSTEDVALENAIRVFPNPSNGKFFIKNLSTRTLKTVKLFDVGGRLVTEYNWSTSQKQKTINTANIPSGVYFIFLTMDNNTSIIEKLTVI